MSHVILQTDCDHNLRSLIESIVYVKQTGYRYIKIPRTSNKHSEEFLYLGFTKAGNPKFGQILSSGPDGIKIQKRIGRLDEKGLRLMGGSYFKSLDEMRESFYRNGGSL